ncbi:hypothetical protein RZS08_16560, partial [Arthrospira platensis SPKY1]|nr:hypothetical protein [Arthrospira platensis SPKY1]
MCLSSGALNGDSSGCLKTRQRLYQFAWPPPPQFYSEPSMTSPEIAQVPGTEHPNKAANVAQACLPPLDLLFLSAPLPLGLTRRSDGELLAVNDA